MKEFIFKLFNFKVNKDKKPGPNTLSELLQQFDNPPKVKTNEDIIRDYLIKETMAALELEYLRTDPSIAYTGHQYWVDYEGTKFCDFVPCVVRPDVMYCANGKN